MDELSVQFDATSGDVESLHRHHMAGGPFRWIRLAGNLIVLLLAASLVVPAIMLARLGEWDIALPLGLTAVGVAGLWAAYRVLMPKISSGLMLANSQNRFYALGHRVISAAPSGLTVTHPGGSQEITWDGVYRVEKGDGAIYVYYTPRAAIWLPERAFGSPESFDAAYVAIKDWHAAGRSVAVTATSPT